MQLVNDDGTAVIESPVDYQRFFANPGFIHYAGMISPPRPGVDDCIQMLEHTNYKPGSDRNHLFVIRVLEWQDILWAIVSIPIAEKANMERIAQVNGLRVETVYRLCLQTAEYIISLFRMTESSPWKTSPVTQSTDRLTHRY
jgi:hypothetical protein